MGVHGAAIGLFRILGIELELAYKRGSCGVIFSHANIFNDIPPHLPISLHCKLVPVQHQKYKYGLLLLFMACIAGA